jgi:hypothetical protein
MKAAWLMGVTIVVVGCSSPQLPNNQTAEARFAALSGNGERQIAHDFYGLGEGDAIKRLYWAQRRMQEQGGTADARPTRLQRKYVVLPVPEHVEPDGTIKEANNQVVEVVQLWAVTRSHGKNLFIVK